MSASAQQRDIRADTTKRQRDVQHSEGEKTFGAKEVPPTRDSILEQFENILGTILGQTHHADQSTEAFGDDEDNRKNNVTCYIHCCYIYKFLSIFLFSQIPRKVPGIEYVIYCSLQRYIAVATVGVPAVLECCQLRWRC